jgi:hypothetical protein
MMETDAVSETLYKYLKITKTVDSLQINSHVYCDDHQQKHDLAQTPNM